MPIYFYCSMVFDRQARPSLTIDQQLSIIKRAGYDIEENYIVRDYASNSINRAHCSGLKTLLEKCIKRGDVIVVTDLKRLGSDIGESIWIVDLLIKKGVKVINIEYESQDITEFDDPLDLLITDVFQEFSVEHQRNRTSKRGGFRSL